MLDTQIAPWPCFTEEEADAVRRVLLSNKVNYWTGEECRSFEREFAAWAGTRYAVALGNGTLALDVALRALGIGAGDEVIVPPRTFMATASAVVQAGAVPVFADVDIESGNITADTITRVLSPRTRAVICVHLAGWPCDMDPIMDLARRHRLMVIEDCAQAHGARYKGRSVGSIGDVGAWSFCQDKIMTTGGEGGMVTTDREDLWRAMWSLKDHGKSWEAVYERAHPPGFRWVHDSFGHNWRMTEIQATIGRIQLRRMAGWTAARAANAERLAAFLRPYAGPNGFLRLPAGPGESGVHGWYRFCALVRPENLPAGWSRDRLVAAIAAHGMPCLQGSCSEIYLEKAFEGTGWRPSERLPVARLLGETSLTLLVHPTLTDGDFSHIGRVLQAVFTDLSTTDQASLAAGQAI